MFFRKRPAPAEAIADLGGTVARALPNVDAETRKIVVAIAGLLGCVSYADQRFSDDERTRVAALLSTIDGIDPAAAQSTLAAIEKDIILIATVDRPVFARTLKQLGDRALRLRVLDMLLDVAAADHDVSHQEVVVLRQITAALGLDQSDYNQLQSQHRDKLSSLKS